MGSGGGEKVQKFKTSRQFLAAEDPPWALDQLLFPAAEASPHLNEGAHSRPFPAWTHEHLWAWGVSSRQGTGGGAPSSWDLTSVPPADYVFPGSCPSLSTKKGGEDHGQRSQPSPLRGVRRAWVHVLAPTSWLCELGQVSVPLWARFLICSPPVIEITAWHIAV